MKQLKLGFIDKEDIPQAVEWLNKTPQNLFDPGILNYPTLKILKSYNSVPVAYMPVQNALVLESLAVDQEAPLLEKAQAFRDLVKGAELYASSMGMKELYMACIDPNVIEVAKSHGFEVLPYTMLRMKL